MSEKNKKDPLMNLEKNLKKANDAVSNTLKAENSYKSNAWFIYVVMVLVAFFISLGNSEFDWSKIGTAQFWIDFSITFFGGLLIKYAWGKWGDAEGHRHPEVINALKEVSDDNKEIEKLGLLELFEDYLTISNNRRKLKAIKKKTYLKLRKTGITGLFVRKKYWKNIKECLLKSERALDNSEINKEEIKEFLDEKNFDLDTFSIKYHPLKKDTLQTGYSSPVEDEDKMSYSEYYQLFGRNIKITLISFVITILLAITSVAIEDISGKTLFIFFTRFGVFSMNAYVGFSIGKTGVETIKLNILKKIHRFLSTFLEINKPMLENNMEVK